MDMFKEYGITKEELLSTLSEAINVIDKTEDPDGLADRLYEALAVVTELTKDYRK